MSEPVKLSMSMNENSMQVEFSDQYSVQSIKQLIGVIRLGFDYYKYPQVILVMNSPGGETRAMKSLLEEMESLPKKNRQLTIVAGNLCASAGAMVLAHGVWGTRIASCETVLLFHSPSAHLRAEQAINREAGERLVRVLSASGSNSMNQLVVHIARQAGGIDALLLHMRQRLDEVTQHWNTMSNKLYEFVEKKNDKPTAVLQRLGSQLVRWSKLKNESLKIEKLIDMLTQRFDLDTSMDLREAYALCLIDKVDNLLPVAGYVPVVEDSAAPDPTPLDTPRSCG